MGIRAGLGNLISGTKQAFSAAFSELGARMRATFDSAVTRIGSIYTGGFIGINANNWGVIKEAVEKLITAAEDNLDKFNELANRDDALKGEAAGALGEYLVSSKNLLYAYITTYRNFITGAEEALAKMTEGDVQNAQAIRNAATDVQSLADSIRID